MKIGVDIDNTIMNTDVVLKKKAIEYDEKLRKTGIIHPEETYLFHQFDWDEEEAQLFIQDVLNPTIKEITPFQSVISIFGRLRTLGYELIVLSSRTDSIFEDADILTTEWFSKYKIPYHKILTNVTDKKQACIDEKIDLFVDDNLEICKYVAELEIPIYLFNPAEYQEKTPWVIPVSSWDEIYSHIMNHRELPK